MSSLVFAIETSCDDTSVALVESSGNVIAMESMNQDEIHGPFGGIIPEMACRNHTMRILPIIDKLLKTSGINLDKIDGIAVTNRPGLLGALLVGVTTAKTLALVHNKPLIGVNHIEGHLNSAFLKTENYSPPKGFGYPFVGLCVSGGHTSLYLVEGISKLKLLGQTLDDAAGEAFDKFGKTIGLGYPAGHLVDRLAAEGDKNRFEFPRALVKKKDDLNFSFSGLKTAGLLAVQKLGESYDDKTKRDLCASYQNAIVDVLIEKLSRAVKKTKVKNVVLAGGVSANSQLRQATQNWASTAGVNAAIPPLKFCTDNAAMIGYVGAQLFQAGEKDDLKLNPMATLNAY